MSYDLDSRKRYILWLESIKHFNEIETVQIAYNNQSKQIDFTVPAAASFKQFKMLVTDWFPLNEIGRPISSTNPIVLGHKAEFIITLKMLVSFLPFIKLNVIYRHLKEPNVFDNTNIQLFQYINNQDITANRSLNTVSWNVGFLNILQQTPTVPNGDYIDPVTGEFKNKRTNVIDTTPITPFKDWQDYEMKLLLTIRNPHYYTSA